MDKAININLLLNDIDLHKRYECADWMLKKAIHLLTAAAKMASDAAYLLEVYAKDKDERTKIYAKLASEIVNESSTLAASALSICDECK